MSENNEFAAFKDKFQVDSLQIAKAAGWTLSLRPQQLTLGAMVISSSSGAQKFSDVDVGLGAGFFQLLAVAEELSVQVFGAKRINSIALMMKDPIVHFHIIPRYDAPVDFGSIEWVDKAWPGPPSFGNDETDAGLLKKIHAEYTRYLENKEPKRKLKSWMAGTLAHYERCDSVFHREFGDHLYAVGGTLLGGIRDSGFISHDKDMDVAYLSRHQDIPDVRREFLQRIIHLLDLGERVTIVDRAGVLQRRHAKWWGEGRSYVDLFPACYDRDGYYSRPTFVRIKLPKDDLLPLRQVQFEGASIFVPNRTERKIHAIFGEGWQVPDPSWKKPVFDGVETMRKAFAFTWKEVKAVAERSRHEDKLKLNEILEKWAAKK